MEEASLCAYVRVKLATCREDKMRLYRVRRKTLNTDIYGVACTQGLYAAPSAGERNFIDAAPRSYDVFDNVDEALAATSAHYAQIGRPMFHR